MGQTGKRMDVTITEAGREDIHPILALQRLAYRSEAELNGDWTIPPLTQTLAEIEAEFAGKTFLKAVAGGRLVGSVRAAQVAGTCLIGRLIVHPDCQGRGIGTRLLSEIEGRFPRADRFELFTGGRSRANIRLYRRLGYREFREADLSPTVRLVFLEKANPLQLFPTSCEERSNENNDPD